MKIVVVGPLPRQFERIRRRIGGRAELQLASSQDGFGKVMQAVRKGAYVVANTKFMQHDHFNHMDRSRCILCQGGDTAVVRAIEALLSAGSCRSSGASRP